METTTFDTKPLLRPRQVEEAKSEIKASEDKLKNPHIEDKGEAMKQLRRLRESFEKQVPRGPVNGDEEGRMVARSKQLLSEIVPAMCSQEEMRKCPPGSVDKFMAGENSPVMKSKILEWKNLQLRLKPGQQEAANLERHRPVSSTLNMDNAVITGKTFFLPPEGAAQSVTFSDEQIALLKQLDPKLADMLAILPNETRAEVKTIVSVASLAGKKSARVIKAKKAQRSKRQMSPEARKAWGEKMKLARAAKKAA